MALLADDDLGLAMQVAHPLGPFRHLVELVVRGFFPLDVIFLAEDKHHDVGVLLDRARFPKVAQLGPLVVAAFDLTAQLRQGDNRDIQFLGDGFQTLGDLRNLVDPAVLRGRGAEKLQVVDKERIEPVLAFQAAGPGGELADRQGGRVVDIKRAGLKRLCGIDEAAEFGLGHVAAPDLFRRDFRDFRQDTGGQLLRGHLEREEPDHAPVNRAFGPVGPQPLAVVLGDVEGDVGRKRGLPHRGATGQDQKVGLVQAPEFLVEIGKPGRQPGQLPVALIGGVRDLDRIGDRRQERLEAALAAARAGQGVKLLLGLDDLVARLDIRLDMGGPGGDVAAKPDQLAPDLEVKDHLGVVPRRKGREGRAREPREVSRAAELLQAGIVLHEGLDRHRRGKRAAGNPGRRDLVDPAMDRVEEMLGFDKVGDAVIDLVVRQDRAEKLLLGLDRMRQNI